MNQVRLLLTFGMLMMLGACTLGPNYVRPELVVPMAFKEAAGWKAAEPRDEVTRGAWWELFADATLNDLVSQVEVSNQNIRTAEAQYRQSEALASQARAGLYPSLSGNAGMTRSQSTNLKAGSANSPVTLNSLGLSASWETDIWGKVRRQVESGNASLQASAANLQAAKLSAQATLAQDYFPLSTGEVINVDGGFHLRRL